MKIFPEARTTISRRRPFCAVKRLIRYSLVFLSLGAAWAQQTAPTKTAKKARPALLTAQEGQALREALDAEHQQIQQLRQEMQQRDEALRQSQQQLQHALEALVETRNKAVALESTSKTQEASVAQLQGDLAEVKTNLTSVASNSQEQRKRVSEVEGVLGRFRLSGDIRIRHEDAFQDYAGCPTCVPRFRERMRLRLGVESKLNEDFSAGIFLASGVLTDPISTNETFTNNFERKTVGFDRGYLTYNPQAHKWLSVTAGKFAYTWQRTAQTFDPDLNPEGFSEKLSFDLDHSVVKNVSFTGLQLLFNEAANPASPKNCKTDPTTGQTVCLNSGNLTGSDSYAAGGQVLAVLKPVPRITLTPSYTLLNWRNENGILNAPSTVTGSTAIVCVPITSLTPAPTPTKPLVPTCALTSGPFGTQGVTNDTVQVGTVNGIPVFRFNSHFLYSDFILDSNINTGWKRWPWRVLAEYEQNLNAVASKTTGTPQDKLYLIETSLGQLKQNNDLIVGYAFEREEQDAVIASFVESEQRAPTNVLQHRIYFGWQVRKNTSFNYTFWMGRTLNSNLVNAALAPGLKAGQQDPWLKRLQFDVLYRF